MDFFPNSTTSATQTGFVTLVKNLKINKKNSIILKYCYTWQPLRGPNSLFCIIWEQEKWTNVLLLDCPEFILLPHKNLVRNINVQSQSPTNLKNLQHHYHSWQLPCGLNSTSDQTRPQHVLDPVRTESGVGAFFAPGYALLACATRTAIRPHSVLDLVRTLAGVGSPVTPGNASSLVPHLGLCPQRVLDIVRTVPGVGAESAPGYSLMASCSGLRSQRVLDPVRTLAGAGAQLAPGNDFNAALPCLGLCPRRVLDPVRTAAGWRDDLVTKYPTKLFQHLGFSSKCLLNTSCTSTGNDDIVLACSLDTLTSSDWPWTPPWSLLALPCVDNGINKSPLPCLMPLGLTYICYGAHYNHAPLATRTRAHLLGLLDAYNLNKLRMTENYSLPRPSALVDQATNARLLGMTKKPALTAKDINLVLELGQKYKTKKLIDLVSRAEREKAEIERLLAVVPDGSWIHELLLKATTMQEADIQRLAAVDTGDLDMGDVFGRSLCDAAKRWCNDAPRRETAATEVSDTARLTTNAKRKACDAQAGEGEDADMCTESAAEDIELFQDSLEGDELGYRELLRDSAKEASNQEAATHLTELLPGVDVCDAVIVAGVHEKYPPADLLLLLELVARVRRLEIDMEALRSSLDDGSACIHMCGNLCTYLIPLSAPAEFVYGESPFGRQHPQAWLATDREHPPIKGVFSKGTLTFPVQGSIRLADSCIKIEIAYGRGLLDGDAFEVTMGLLTAETRARLAPVAESHGFQLITEVCQAFRYKNLGPSKGTKNWHKSSRDNSDRENAPKDKWINAKEIFLRISVAYDGFGVDEENMLKEATDALGLGPSRTSRQVERGGFHFIYCKGENDFDDNFPAHFLCPSPHAISVLECVHEGKSHFDVLHILQQTCYDFCHVLNIFFGRGFTTDNSGKIAEGRHFQDRLYIMWKGTNSAGTLSTVTMDLLISAFALGRSHHRLTAAMPGLEGLLQLNKVMVLMASGSEGKLKFSASAPLSVTAHVSGATQFAPLRGISTLSHGAPSPRSPPIGAAFLNTRENHMEHDRLSYRAAVGSSCPSGGSSGGGASVSGSSLGSVYSPFAVLNLSDGSRMEYTSPMSTPGRPSATPPSDALVDARTIERIVIKKVTDLVQAQMAPLQRQNDELKAEVTSLKEGLARMSNPWESEGFQSTMLKLLTRANADGRADAANSSSKAGPHDGANHSLY